MVLIAPNKVGENDKQTFKDAYEALKSGKISRLKDDDDVSNPLSQRVHQWEEPIKVPLKKIEIEYDEDLSEEEKNGLKQVREDITKQEGERDNMLREYAKTNHIVPQLIDLALLQNGLLKGEALSRFVKRSVELIG